MRPLVFSVRQLNSLAQSVGVDVAPLQLSIGHEFLFSLQLQAVHSACFSRHLGYVYVQAEAAWPLPPCSCPATPRAAWAQRPPPITSPPAPIMSEREWLSEASEREWLSEACRFLDSLDGGVQATVLFSLDNDANDATVSMRPTPNFDALATSLRSRAPSARRCSAPPSSPRLW